MNNNVKLYNLIFPVWLLWLIPTTWVIVLPVNFLIDLIVIVLTMKALKIKNIMNNVKAIVLWVWVFGFLADLIGTAIMFIANLINFNYETALGEWWYHNISNAVSYNPFNSIYSIIWVTASVAITAFVIYQFNYRFCLKKSDLDYGQKKRLALSIAVFTAPYVFYIPTAWFF